jgi:hypothetical protein
VKALAPAPPPGPQGGPPADRRPPPARLAVKLTGVTAALLVLALLAGTASPGFPLSAVPSAIATAIRSAKHATHHTPEPGRPPGPGEPGRAGPAGASPLALADIPRRYLALYAKAAAACPRLTWQLLAGIGKVESDHGRSSAPGVRSGVNRAGCCAGPMQFNLRDGPPSTWDSFGRGGNPYDPADAIPAAARKLCAGGLAGPEPRVDPCPQVLGGAALHLAVKRYNNACWYVHEVVTVAARYAAGAVGVPRPSQDPFVVALAHDPRIASTRSHGCDPGPDLASGKLDLRVESILAVIAERWTIRVSCARTGHSRYVKGTRRVSNHTVWRAVDIDQVDSQPVSAGNATAAALVRWLDGLEGPLRPSEIGSPFDLGHRPYFTDEGHTEHVHIGYPARDS